MSGPIDDDRLPTPRKAALRDEREQTVETLQEAFAVGHLDMEELEERLDLAESARTSSELAVLTDDLPTVGRRPDSTALALARTTQPLVLTAIFGGAERRGVWAPPAQMRARAIFGGIEIDLREASLAPGTITEIACTAIFGGVEIAVPPTVRVECQGAGIFGGFAHRTNTPDDPDAPTVRVTGRAIFGGVEVKVRSAEPPQRSWQKKPNALPRE